MNDKINPNHFQNTKPKLYKNFMLPLAQFEGADNYLSLHNNTELEHMINYGNTSWRIDVDHTHTTIIINRPQVTYTTVVKNSYLETHPLTPDPHDGSPLVSIDSTTLPDDVRITSEYSGSRF